MSGLGPQGNILPALLMMLKNMKGGGGGPPTPGQNMPGQPPMMSMGGGPSAPPPGAQPAQVGGTPPQMTPTPQINWNPSGTGASMPPPVAPPTPQNPQQGPNPGMMDKLNPKGAATYQAITGVAQLLGDFKQKKQERTNQYATQLATNLMDAMKKGDQKEIMAILTDDKAMKVLDKVYKGWLTKDKEMNKPDKPQDPEVKAFEGGVAKAAGGDQPPQGGQQPPPQGQQPPQQQQQGGLPRSMAGRMLPQSMPQDRMTAATGNAQEQYAKDDPNSLIEGPMTPERMAHQEKLQADIATAQSKLEQAHTNLMTAQEHTKTAAQQLQTETIKRQAAAGKQQSDKERSVIQKDTSYNNFLKSAAQLDAQKTVLQIRAEQLQILKTKGAQQDKNAKVPMATQMKLNSLDKVDDLLSQVGSSGKFSETDVQNLTQEMKSAGVPGLAKMLPNWFQRMYQGQGTVDDIKGALSTYRNTIEKTLDDTHPNWNKAKSASKDAKNDKSAASADDEPDDNDDTDIDVTDDDMNKEN